MGVKQENRYRKMVVKASQVADDRRRELEAAFMERGPRQPAATPAPTASRRQVRLWMRRNADFFDCATYLAEAANAALELPHGALEDDGHWIWEEALSALDK